jgi:hypothetical protein
LYKSRNNTANNKNQGVAHTAEDVSKQKQQMKISFMIKNTSYEGRTGKLPIPCSEEEDKKYGYLEITSCYNLVCLPKNSVCLSSVLYSY